MIRRCCCCCCFASAGFPLSTQSLVGCRALFRGSVKPAEGDCAGRRNKRRSGTQRQMVSTETDGVPLAHSVLQRLTTHRHMGQRSRVDVLFHELLLLFARHRWLRRRCTSNGRRRRQRVQMLWDGQVGTLARTQLVRCVVTKYHDVSSKGDVAFCFHGVEDQSDVARAANRDGVDRDWMCRITTLRVCSANQREGMKH